MNTLTKLKLSEFTVVSTPRKLLDLYVHVIARVYYMYMYVHSHMHSTRPPGNLNKDMIVILMLFTVYISFLKSKITSVSRTVHVYCHTWY